MPQSSLASMSITTYGFFSSSIASQASPAVVPATAPATTDCSISSRAIRNPAGLFASTMRLVPSSANSAMAARTSSAGQPR